MRISDWSSDVCSSDLRFYASLGFDAGRWYGAGRYRDTENIYVEGRQGGIANGHVYWFSITGYWPKKLVNFQNVHNSVQRNVQPYRSVERRVGQECVITCRSRWSTYN